VLTVSSTLIKNNEAQKERNTEEKRDREHDLLTVDRTPASIGLSLVIKLYLFLPFLEK
jgi:hypothetical protein